MKKEYIEFLNNLKNEMLSQDTYGQAEPRFWVIMQKVREYWVTEDSGQYFIFNGRECECVVEGDMKDIADWLEELEDVISAKYEDDALYVKYIDVYGKEIEDIVTEYWSLEEFLSDFKPDVYSVGKFRVRNEIVPDTMFITLKDCKEHLKANGHHYNETAIPYAMTAFRSPSISKLYEAIQNTNWEELLNE